MDNEEAIAKAARARLEMPIVEEMVATLEAQLIEALVNLDKAEQDKSRFQAVTAINVCRKLKRMIQGVIDSGELAKANLDAQQLMDGE